MWSYRTHHCFMSILRILFSRIKTEMFKRHIFFIRVVVIIFVAIFVMFNIYFIKHLKLTEKVSTLKNSPNPFDIIRNIKHYNKLQHILNEDRFGPLKSDSVVIVVQVHNRIEYLRYLITSLAQTKYISKTLLIFSHDYYDENINDLIQKIDFCKVLQIFYPYSIQTHEHTFPGDDPNDCPPNIKRDQAIERKCNNVLHPDRYGNYRVAKFTQAKHHWWWKANHVFDQLEVTRKHTGLVLFLEEDHYVSEDFLHVLKSMQKHTKQFCTQCNIFTLGIHLNPFAAYMHTKTNEVAIARWRHNLGFSFNRSTWNEIRKCANHFCTYDDYNWDFTLRYVSQQCLRKKLYTMVALRARIFHIGKCGLHQKNKNCNSNEEIARIQFLLQNAKSSKQLYPSQLKITQNIIEDTPLGNSNGGWSDVRDHYLCLNFTKSKTQLKFEHVKFVPRKIKYKMN